MIQSPQMIRFRNEMPLSTGTEGPQEGKHIVYPWNMSATREFDQKELRKIRDEEPKVLAEVLWPGGKAVRNRALIELIAHGNPRKAAEVTRAQTTEHPKQTTLIKKQLEEAFGSKAARMLLTQNLSSIPSSPKEFPPDTVTYIQ